MAARPGLSARSGQGEVMQPKPAAGVHVAGGDGKHLPGVAAQGPELHVAVETVGVGDDQRARVSPWTSMFAAWVATASKLMTRVDRAPDACTRTPVTWVSVLDRDGLALRAALSRWSARPGVAGGADHRDHRARAG